MNFFLAVVVTPDLLSLDNNKVFDLGRCFAGWASAFRAVFCLVFEVGYSPFEAFPHAALGR